MEPERRLDVAMPEEVRVGRFFDLAVAVMQPWSPPLQVDELTRVRSGEARVEWPEGASFVTLRAAVHAPDCDIFGQPFQMFRLHWGEDSPTVFFSLQPRRAGELPIRVTLYQRFMNLGSARLTGLAVEREVGDVVARVTSQEVVQVNPELLYVLPQRANEELFGVYSLLVHAFSMEELQALAYDLGVDWDDLPGTTRQRKAGELVNYCHRRRNVEQLIEHVIIARPNWLDLIEEAA